MFCAKFSFENITVLFYSSLKAVECPTFIMQTFLQETALITLGYSPGSFCFYWAAVLQKGGDDTVKNAAFEEKNVILCLSYFFLCVGEGREAAKITSSITGRNQVTNRHRKHR